jgi:hypothetical protein
MKTAMSWPKIRMLLFAGRTLGQGRGILFYTKPEPLKMGKYFFSFLYIHAQKRSGRSQLRRIRNENFLRVIGFCGFVIGLQNLKDSVLLI